MLKGASNAAEKHLPLQVMTREGRVFAVNNVGLMLKTILSSKDNALSALAETEPF